MSLFLNHTNVLSYIEVIRRDTNVGDRVAIIRAGGIGFNTKSCIEDWGVDGTNDARAGAAAAVPSYMLIGWRRKQQMEGGEEGEAYCPDAKKDWKYGKPRKDKGMDLQGGIGQER